MSKPRSTNRRYRFEAAEPRVRRPRSRRLAIETMESRLMLSGNQIASNDLDYSIWNLDSIQEKYAIISQGGALPDAASLPPATMNFRESGGPTLDVEWVTVPGMAVSPAAADMLAYQHLREAVSAGIFSSAEIAPLYTQWRNNLGSNSGLDSTAVYAVGIVRSSPAPSINSFDDAMIGLDADTSVLIQGAPGSLSLIGAVVGPRENGGSFGYPAGTTNATDLQTGGTLAHSEPSTSEFQSNGSPVDTNVINAAAGPLADAPTVPPVSAPPVVIVAQSDSDGDLDNAVEHLLSDHEIIVSHTPLTDTSLTDDTSSGVVSSVEPSPPATVLTTDETVGTAEVVAAADSSSDGGMISIEEIVAAVDPGSVERAPAAGKVASGSDETPIVGELARVAVMELIEGEADPAAPQPSTDHTSLVATSDAAIMPPTVETQLGSQRTGSQWALKVFVEQAGLASAMIAPVNPVYWAAIASVVSDAAATSTILPPSTETPADAARNAAFSQWGDDKQLGTGAAVDTESHRWRDAAPILVALACERVVAAKKKRQQRDPVRQPVKAK